MTSYIYMIVKFLITYCGPVEGPEGADREQVHDQPEALLAEISYTTTYTHKHIYARYIIYILYKLMYILYTLTYYITTYTHHITYTLY